MVNTLNYYNQNANQFVEGTLSVDFQQTQDRFLEKLTAGACVLDFGCGSGRDTKYFLKKGYQVERTAKPPPPLTDVTSHMNTSKSTAITAPDFRLHAYFPPLRR